MRFAVSALAQAAWLLVASTALADPDPAPASPEEGNTLERVTVGGTRKADTLPGGQQSRKARVGALGDKDVLDTPFATASYTEAYIQDRQATSVAAVLAANPSIRPNIQGFKDGEQFISRGFPLFSFYNYDGLTGMTTGRTSIEALDRVEFFKGPSAGINGQTPALTAAGGTINLVPKRATEAPITRLAFSHASDSYEGIHADVGRRFGPNNAWGVRLNAVRRVGDTELDGQHNAARLGALALDYRGERLRASVDVIGDRAHTTGVSRVAIVQPSVTRIPDAPNGRNNFAQAWEYFDNINRFAIGRVEFDFTTDLTAYAAHGVSRAKQLYFSSNANITNNAGDTTSTGSWYPTFVRRNADEAGLRGRLLTGSVTHAFAFTLSRVSQEQGYASIPVPGFTYASNIYAPKSYPALSDQGYSRDLPLAARNVLTSAGLVDTVGFLNDQVQVTLGARRQRVESPLSVPAYDQRKTTPMLAAVVKLQPSLSVYGNYVESLQSGPTAPAGTVNAGEVFAPFAAKQRELGVKWEHGGWLLSSALFEIKQPNQMVDTATNRFGVFGEQRNRGLEFEFAGEAVAGLRLIGGAAWLQPLQTRTAGGINDGKDGIGAPRRTANLGADWSVPGMPGLALTGLAIYTASQFYNATNTLSVPAWTRLDVGVRYATAWGGVSTTLRLNVENVTDRAYWASTGRSFLTLGAPRTVRASATFDF